MKILIDPAVLKDDHGLTRRVKRQAAATAALPSPAYFAVFALKGHEEEVRQLPDLSQAPPDTTETYAMDKEELSILRAFLGTGQRGVFAIFDLSGLKQTV